MVTQTLAKKIENVNAKFLAASELTSKKMWDFESKYY